MTTKSNILKSAFIAASISAGIAVAYAFQPANFILTESQVYELNEWLEADAVEKFEMAQG